MWWFQIVFTFSPIWGRCPIWLIFFRWVETTNQIMTEIFIKITLVAKLSMIRLCQIAGNETTLIQPRSLNASLPPLMDLGKSNDGPWTRSSFYLMEAGGHTHLEFNMNTPNCYILKESLFLKPSFLVSTLNFGGVPSVHAFTSCWLRTPSTDGSILSKQARWSGWDNCLGSRARYLGLIGGFYIYNVSKFRGPTYPP